MHNGIGRGSRDDDRSQMEVHQPDAGTSSLLLPGSKTALGCARGVADAVKAYEGRGAQFIISVRKTARLVEELKASDWKRSPRTDADGQCEFSYQPEGKEKPIGSSPCPTKRSPSWQVADEPEQYQLFDTPEYTYRVFVTNMKRALDQRAGAENLIKGANNDAGLAA